MAEDRRLISTPLMLGLIALPIVFVWLLFRPGYARSTRTVALVYTFATPVLALVTTALIAVGGKP